MKNNTFSAFTIIELLVALVISGILMYIIGIGFLKTEKMTRQGIASQSKRINTILFHQIIRTDIEKSNQIRFSSHEIILFDENTAKVNYTITGDNVIRKDLQNKTSSIFDIKIVNIATNSVCNITQDISLYCLNDTDTICIKIFQPLCNSAKCNNSILLECQ